MMNIQAFVIISFVVLAGGGPTRFASATMDLFCFAGQSNMLGWSLGGQSIGSNSTFLIGVIHS